MEITWNFNGVRSNNFFGTQADWNQTLLTRMNEINASRFQAGHSHYEIITEVKVPKKFKPIFESIVYYNNKNSNIADRYHVDFSLDNSKSYILFPNDYKIIIENYNPEIYQ